MSEEEGIMCIRVRKAKVSTFDRVLPCEHCGELMKDHWATVTPHSDGIAKTVCPADVFKVT
jgi:hypothetical protein